MLLHLSTTDALSSSHAAAEAEQQTADAALAPETRTYRLHAVVLRTASMYLKTCLTAWQQQQHRKRCRHNPNAAQATAASGEAEACSGIRFEVTVTLEAGQLAAAAADVRPACPTGYTN